MGVRQSLVTVSRTARRYSSLAASSSRRRAVVEPMSTPASSQSWVTVVRAVIVASARRRFAPSRVADVDARVRLVVGTDDEALPVDRARRLVDALPDADLVLREGEDHSFRGDDREPEIVDQTLAVL
jgi:pimeloyl-ACP methyl ester carboxylesterase